MSLGRGLAQPFVAAEPTRVRAALPDVSMRWLDSITNLMEMNLSKLREIVEDRGAWQAAVYGSNPGLLHRKWILYQLNHKGSPIILDWVT